MSTTTCVLHVSGVPVRLDDLLGRRAGVAGVACRLPPSHVVSLVNLLASTVAAALVRSMTDAIPHYKATIVG